MKQPTTGGLPCNKNEYLTNKNDQIRGYIYIMGYRISEYHIYIYIYIYINTLYISWTFYRIYSYLQLDINGKIIVNQYFLIRYLNVFDYKRLGFTQPKWWSNGMLHGDITLLMVTFYHTLGKLKNMNMICQCQY